jgi:hypothetical protein
MHSDIYFEANHFQHDMVVMAVNRLLEHSFGMSEIEAQESYQPSDLPIANPRLEDARSKLVDFAGRPEVSLSSQELSDRNHWQAIYDAEVAKELSSDDSSED